MITRIEAKYHNIVRHYINDYKNWGKISIRCWIHKDTPYLALLGELCGVFCEYSWENWPHGKASFQLKNRGSAILPLTQSRSSNIQYWTIIVWPFAHSGSDRRHVLQWYLRMSAWRNTYRKYGFQEDTVTADYYSEVKILFVIFGLLSYKKESCILYFSC